MQSNMSSIWVAKINNGFFKIAYFTASNIAKVWY